MGNDCEVPMSGSVRSPSEPVQSTTAVSTSQDSDEALSMSMSMSTSHSMSMSMSQSMSMSMSMPASSSSQDTASVIGNARNVGKASSTVSKASPAVSVILLSVLSNWFGI